MAPHLSRDQGILLNPGDVIEVSPPGGGAYGLSAGRSKVEIERDIMRGHYTRDEAMQRFGVALRSTALDRRRVQFLVDRARHRQQRLASQVTRERVAAAALTPVKHAVIPFF